MAVLLSEEIKERLAKVSAQLKLTGADVKWVERDNYHVTLFFFGDTSPDTCDAIISAMPEITSGVEPFGLSLDGMGAFPSLRRPKVIWAGVKQGGREIIQVHRRVLGAVESLGFTEDKKFSPHVTMGRVRSQSGRGVQTKPNCQGNLARLIQSMEKINGLGEDFITGISLMESLLTPRGPVYSELAFAKFSPK